MARCEDFPCCGHEPGCCPDYDPETGKQLNMKCVCGATLPLDSRFSVCESCMNDDRDCDDREFALDRDEVDRDHDPLDDLDKDDGPVEMDADGWSEFYANHPDYDMDHDHSMDY